MAQLPTEVIFDHITKKGKMKEWIKVQDRLPSKDRRHNWNIVFMPNVNFPRIEMAVYNSQHQWKTNGVDITDEVTHWMEIPEPPKI